MTTESFIRHFMIAHLYLQKNDAWEMFQRMSDNVGKVVKQTEAKLKTLEENTLIRAMPNRQYEMKPPTPPPPENLMDISDEELAKKKMQQSDGKVSLSLVFSAIILVQEELVSVDDN